MKKSKRLGIVLIAIAVILGVLFLLFSFRSEEKSSSNEEVEETEIHLKTPDFDEELEDGEQLPFEDVPIAVLDMNEEFLTYIDQNTNALQEAIETYAYGEGYTSVTEAVWMQSVMIDYLQNTITTEFYLNNKEYTKIQVIYYRDNSQFTVVPY